MGSDFFKELAEVLSKFNTVALGMLLAFIVVIVFWLSWMLVSYLRNKEVGRLIEAVNHNTNSVNLLLELTKLMFGKHFPKNCEGMTNGSPSEKVPDEEPPTPGA